MPRDIEDLIRESLQTRAQDVTPDPATWNRVERRIRRQQTIRWAVAGLTAATALIAAAVVLPSLLTGARVDIGPADQPTPPGPPPVGSPAAGLVWADGGAVWTVDAAGARVRLGDAGPSDQLAVRPGSTSTDLTVARRRLDDCTLLVGTSEGRAPLDEREIVATVGGCVSSPLWSPDGEHLAWLQVTDQTGGGLWSVEIGPSDAAARQSFPVAAPDGFAWIRLTGWAWEGDDGVLYATALDPDRGRREAFLLRVRRAADGTVKPAAGAAFEPDVGGRSPDDPEGDLRYLARATAGGAVEYAVVEWSTGDLALARVEDGDFAGTVPVGAEALASTEFWIAARGDVVVYGDGRDEATRLDWTGDGWAGPTEVGTTVVVAGVLDDAPRMAAPPGPPVPDEVTPDDPTPDDPTAAEEVLALAGRSGVNIRGDEWSTQAEGDRVAIRPGGAAQAVLAVRTTDCAIELVMRSGEALVSEQVAESLQGCVTAPVWSPDGTALTWMDGADLHALSWPSPPQPGDAPAHVASWSFAMNADDVRVTDWVWTEGMGAETAGALYLTGTIGDGSARAFTLPVQRQGDGALAFSADASAAPVAPASEMRTALLVDSHANDGAAVGPEYAIVVRQGAVHLSRSADGDAEASTTEIPLSVEDVDANRVWLSAAGDVVVFGDGNGRAWRATGSDVTELDGEQIVHGSVRLLDGGSDGPVYDSADLPAPVVDKRRAILDAARSEDVEGLAVLAARDDTNLSFGGPPEDLVGWFEMLRDQGELDRLVALLELPHAAHEGMFTWPYAAQRDLRGLSSAELAQLEAVASVEEIEQWTEAGTGWLGWRVGITPDGRWVFYVAGD